MITFDDVHKSYEEDVALRDVSFTVPARQTTVLIGPSGCGKSTILRLILRLTEPDAGSILFDREPVTAQNAHHVRRRIGYVIQEGGLFPHMTARQNVTVMAHHLNWERDRIRKRIRELLGLMDLEEHLLSSFPGELSGGQRQRVSLMRGLFLDPDALLLDEPLSALDPMIRSHLQDELRSIFRTLDKTVLLVTHDMNEAAFFGDTIFLMHDGELVQTGSMSDLAQNPETEFVSRFVRAQQKLHGMNDS